MGDSPPEFKVSTKRLPRLTALLVLGAALLVGHEALYGNGGRATTGRSWSTRRSRPARSRPSIPPRSAPARKVVSAEAVPEAIPAAVRPPAVEKPVDPASLRVRRIVFDPDDPDATFAVIGGRAVRRGDRVGGWAVMRVERDRVLLGPGGKTVLTLTTGEN